MGSNSCCFVGIREIYNTSNITRSKQLIRHVDAGWNTDKAVGNIEKLCNGLGLDLYTDVINWEEMKDLQVAFLKSQIIEVPYRREVKIAMQTEYSVRACIKSGFLFSLEK